MMKIKYWPVLALLGLMTSCDFLDVVPEKMGTVEYVFRDKRSAETFLATCYSYLPDHGGHAYSIGRSMGNEVTTYYRNREVGVKVTTNGNSVTSPSLSYWDGNGNGKNLYRALRDCNDFLDNIHLVRDMDSGEKARWIAEVKFLKAYYHWFLIQHYGPIVLVKKNIPIGADPEEVLAYRSPINECIDYVIELLNECIEPVGEGDDAETPLPLTIEDELNEYGRITLPIAAAIRAKVMVHAASPFYNGNKQYANWTDKRGIKLFPSDYDASKWTRAADACQKAIEICQDAGMQLFEYEPDFTTDISETTRLVLTPSQMITTMINKEAIWQQVKFDSKNVEFYCMPALNSEYRRVMVRSQLAPTLSTVENFYTSNGVPIEEDKEWQEKGWYTNRYTTTYADDEEHRLTIDPKVEVPLLNMHRESRFYGDIAFNGSKWFGAGYPVPDKANPEDYQYTVLSLAGNTSTNPAGRVGQQYYSATGYFTRKLASYKTNVPVGQAFTEDKYFWPIMRLADLYLLYAEALNESQEQPTEDIWKDWIDPIRKRAGLQGVAESWTNHSIYSEKYKTKEGLRNIIHQERVIELALEGHYFYDMRRWSGGERMARYDIMDQMNKPIRGWNCDGEDNESYNQVKVVYSIGFSLRDYLWPIKEEHIEKNPNLEQNPGW